MNAAIQNLTQGQRELLGNQCVHIFWICDQQRGYSGVRAKTVAAANV